MPKTASKPKKDKRSKKAAKQKRTAKTSDRHELYQLSVQAPEVDAPFFKKYFKKLTGRPGRHFREDFCGTALLSCHWVKMHRENSAVAVDLDGPTLRWGQEHNVAKLLDDEQQERIRLYEADVMDAQCPQVDMIAALNFSYSFFMTRDSLRAYMKKCLDNLVDDGVLFFDAWGGSETQEELEEDREVEDFTYVWEQHRFDPITYQSQCRIHFRFKDGTELKNAFKYTWRQWTLPELQELMTEAGFHDVHVLWEGTDPETGEGNEKYTRKKRGEADPGWIAYVIGRKNA